MRTHLIPSGSHHPLRQSLLLLALLTAGALRATDFQDAPTLSAHESAYGVITREGHRENISHLDLRIVSLSKGGEPFRVDCFFLKPAKHGEVPVVDDAVGFEITDPHGTYRVEAKPIPVKDDPKPPKSPKSAKASGKKGKSATPIPHVTPPPPARVGYAVVISREGRVLREVFSDHSVGRMIKDHPDLLTHSRIRMLPNTPPSVR